MTDKKERDRKIFHLVLGLAIALLIYCSIFTELILFLIVIAALAVSVISKRTKIPVMQWFLERFEREKDLRSFPNKGTFYLFLGAFLTLVLFKKDIAAAAVLILALVDSVPALAGNHGKTPHPFNSKKNIEAAFCGFVAAAVASLILIPWYQALLASLAAIIVEGMSIEIRFDALNDNITIPLVSALVIWLLCL